MFHKEAGNTSICRLFCTTLLILEINCVIGVIVMRKQKLVQNNIYHIYNRGVEKRHIFLDDRDYFRFINDLIVFNDAKMVVNPKQRLLDIKNGIHKRDYLVDILAFCLMPNHYHLLLMPKIEGGITEFMRKLGCGYVNYFNIKYKRVGSLFQGRFKSVLIEDESQFIYIPYYIHLNPLGIEFPDWRDKGVKNHKEAINFLDNYSWSSHADYRGKSNFSLILNKSILNEILGDEDSYSESFYDFIKDYDFSSVADLLLE